MMRWLFGMLILLFVTVSIAGQQNPFEVKSRLPEVTVPDDVPEQSEEPSNPFDLSNETRPTDVRLDSAKNANPQGPLLIRRNNEPAVLDARGRTLGIHILLLFL
ncbi:MAG: hypothetical protein AAFU67_08955, partial [Bacteroidota bacterium]